MESESAMEEERRLFYVAVTRAREQLLLTFPYMRTVGRGGGGDTVQRPSRFLGEIPEGLLEEWEITGGAWCGSGGRTGHRLYRFILGECGFA